MGHHPIDDEPVGDALHLVDGVELEAWAPAGIPSLDLDLIDYLRDTLRWHWRIRIKSSFLVYRQEKRRVKIENIPLKRS
jgi:hypothetical protein